jgi:multidrug resistance efflux pump
MNQYHEKQHPQQPLPCNSTGPCHSVMLVLMTLALLATGSATLAEPPAAREQQGLSLATAQPLFPEKVTATGRVEPLISARISARVSGHLVEIGTTEEGLMLDAGMTVKAGQILFKLNETTFRNAVAMAEAQLHSAKAALENLTAPTRTERMEQLRQVVAELDARVADRQREESRYKRLVEEEKTLPVRRLEEVQTELAAIRAQRAAATARLAEAEKGPTPTEIAVVQARVYETEAAVQTAQSDLRDATIRAAFDGMITQRFKSPGDYMTNMPPTEVFELVAIDRLEAELRLPEAYLMAVQAGKTQVTLQSQLLVSSLTLPVSRVVTAVDPGKGTFTLRVTIPTEPRSGLVPGAFVTGDVLIGDQGRGVIVPLRAVVRTADGTAVFVAQDGKMVKRVVEVGERLTESAAVRSGLTRGERVVIGPAETLVDGAALPEYLKAGK